MTSKFFSEDSAKLYEQLEKLNSSFKPVSISLEDKKRAEMVAHDICENNSKTKILSSNEVDFNEMLAEAAMNFYEIGLFNVAKQAVSILNTVQYYSMTDSKEEEFIVYSEVSETGAFYAKKVNSVFVPESFNQSSSVFLCHEIAHILKERNSYECKFVYTLQEVIPMLLELIIAYNKNDLNILREVFRRRQELLSKQAYYYNELNKLTNVSCSLEDKKLLNTALGTCLVYLNSFYYSLALFNCYLDDQDYVIKIINGVLNGNFTTKDMCDVLLIDKGMEIALYQDGMNLFKRTTK